MSRYLAKDLRLQIEYLDEKKQIQVTLSDDLAMETLTICYNVNQGTPANPQRRYYLQEAMVIAMRRVIASGIELGMISNHPGG